MTATATQDLRLKQRAKLLSQGVKRPKLKISAADSQKASVDSVKFISKSYNGGFVNA